MDFTVTADQSVRTNKYGCVKNPVTVSFQQAEYRKAVLLTADGGGRRDGFAIHGFGDGHRLVKRIEAVSGCEALGKHD